MTETSNTAPAQELSRPQILRAFRIWNWEGCTATVQITLTSGAFQTGFALYLGCSNVEIGLLAAIPALLGLLQLFVSFLFQHTQNRKQIVQWYAFISRMLWVPMLLIPFLLPARYFVFTFLFLTFVAAVLSNVSAPLWMAWMSDLIPEEMRGRYFGRRNMYAGVVGMVASVIGGWYLDTATQTHHAGETRIAFALLFGIATIFTIISFLQGMSSPDVPPSQRHPGTAPPGALEFYSAPFRDRNFAQFMIFYAVFAFAQTVAGNFFTVYQLKSLKLDYTAIQSLGAVRSLVSLAVMPLCGYLADKYGNKPILMISVGLVLVPPFLWLMTFPDGIPGLWMYQNHHLLFSYTKLIIIILNIVAGIGWSGVGLTQFNLMLAAAPATQRTVYVSAISGVAGIAGGIGPLLGGVILTALADVHFPKSGLVRSNYAILFIITGILRFVGLLLLRPLKEQGSRSAGFVLGQLRSTPPLGTMTSLRRLARGDSARSREQAARQLAQLKTPLAVEELVKALDDVALPVREQAAVALGEIGDTRATEPLVQKMADPASGITSMAATALGKIGDESALPALAAAAQLGPPARQLAALEALGHLGDPRVTDVLLGVLQESAPEVRIAAIRALAEREDPRSALPLAECLSQERDLATVAVLADALGRIGDSGTAHVLVEALDRSGSATVRREILNAIGSVLGGRDAFYPYLALDPFARDEAVTKILTTIQRRYRTRAVQKIPGTARFAARARQALRAYTAGDLSFCLTALIHLAHALSPEGSSQETLACLEMLRQNHQRQGTAPSYEEVLLAVFVVRHLTDYKISSSDSGDRQ